MKEIYLSGYIGEDITLTKVQSVFATIKPETEVNIYLNSIGGNTVDGWAIHDYFKQKESEGYKINITGIGIVGSAATFVFLSVANRKLTKNTGFFIHNPFVGMIDKLDASSATSMAKALTDEEARIIALYTSTSNIDEAMIKDLMKAETEFTAKEAVEYGFASEVLEPTYGSFSYVIQNNLDMNILNELKAIRKSLMKGKNAMAQTDRGEIYFDAAEIEVGTNLFSDELMENPVEGGDYTLEDGTVLVVGEAGAVIEIKAPTTEVEATADEDEEKEALKKALEEKEEEIKAMKAEMEAVKNEMMAIKSLVKNFEPKKVKVAQYTPEPAPSPFQSAFETFKKAKL
jgi:ATP-dependent Clp protease protease subunit